MEQKQISSRLNGYCWEVIHTPDNPPIKINYGWNILGKWKFNEFFNGKITNYTHIYIVSHSNMDRVRVAFMTIPKHCKLYKLGSQQINKDFPHLAIEVIGGRGITWAGENVFSNNMSQISPDPTFQDWVIGFDCDKRENDRNHPTYTNIGIRDYTLIGCEMVAKEIFKLTFHELNEIIDPNLITFNRLQEGIRNVC